MNSIRCKSFVVSVSYYDETYYDESLDCHLQRLNKRAMPTTIGSRILLGPSRGATSSTAIRSN